MIQIRLVTLTRLVNPTQPTPKVFNSKVLVLKIAQPQTCAHPKIQNQRKTLMLTLVLITKGIQDLILILIMQPHIKGCLKMMDLMVMKNNNNHFRNGASHIFGTYHS